MNKGEFLKAIAESGDFTMKEAGIAYDAFVGAVVKGLKAGEKVQLVGFGTFEVKKKNARTGFNPKTKAPIQIPACKAPNMKFSDGFKALFN